MTGDELKDLLGKSVTLYQTWDINKTDPVTSGKVIGVQLNPTLILEYPDGEKTWWAGNRPMDVHDE